MLVDWLYLSRAHMWVLLGRTTNWQLKHDAVEQGVEADEAW